MSTFHEVVEGVWIICYESRVLMGSTITRLARIAGES